MGYQTVLDCRKIFAEQGLRFTRQRCAIFEALALSDQQPTAEQLYEAVRTNPNCRGISLATVYNTLETLCEVDLCIKLPMTHGCARFDTNLTRIRDHEGREALTFVPDHDPHLHVVDEESGEIHDVPNDLSRALMDRIPREILERIEREMGMEIRRVSLHFVGRPRENGDESGEARADSLAEARAESHTPERCAADDSELNAESKSMSADSDVERPARHGRNGRNRRNGRVRVASFAE